MRARFLQLGRLGLFVLGVIGTARVAMKATWIAGAIFGVVVLTWHVHVHRRLRRLRSVSFLVASAAIFYIVLQILGWSIDPYGGDGNWVAYHAGIALGSLLLSLAHYLILGSAWSRTLVSVVASYVIWWALGMVVSPWLTNLHLLPQKWWPFDQVAAWQGAYLCAMFARVPSRSE